MKNAINVFLPYLKKIYYIVIAICFAGFFGASVIYTNHGWSIGALALLVIFLALSRYVSFDFSWTGWRGMPLVIYGGAFLVRLIYCLFVLPYISQLSDFKIVYDEAISGYFVDCLDYYRFYFHKFLYPYVLNSLSLNTQTRMVIFQCIIVSFVPVVLYLMGKKIVDATIGFLAAVLYSFWPSLILYTQITTEEHISALVTILIIYLIICAHGQIDGMTGWDRRTICSVLCKSIVIGLLCGVASYSKDWALVVFAATAICAIYQILKGNIIQFCVIAVSCVLVLGGRFAFNSMIQSIGEDILGVSPNNGVISMQMYESLDPNSNGAYNVDLNGEYMQMAEDNGYDFDATNSQANAILIEKIKKDYKKMPKMLLHKAQTAYRSNETMVYWALIKETNDEFRTKYTLLEKILRNADQLIYVCVFIMLISSAFVKRNKYIFYLQLITIGGAFVNLVVECQQRYKYSIISVWCIPVAYMAVWLVKKVKRKVQ